MAGRHAGDGHGGGGGGSIIGSRRPGIPHPASGAAAGRRDETEQVCGARRGGGRGERRPRARWACEWGREGKWKRMFALLVGGGSGPKAGGGPAQEKFCIRIWRE